MKRHIIFAALFIGFAFSLTSCNKEVSAQTQTSINNFVATYFPDAEVISSIKDGFDYDVTLSDYTRIEFDGGIFSQPEWDEVNCKHSTVYTAVPSSLVPTEITNYVTSFHPDHSIVKISKDGRGWDIELDNSLEIDFDRKFNVTEIDN